MTLNIFFPSGNPTEITEDSEQRAAFLNHTLYLYLIIVRARSVDSMCKSFSCCTFIGPLPYPPLPIWPPSEFHPESPWPVNCCFYDVHFYSGIWFYRIERRICPFTVYIQIVRMKLFISFRGGIDVSYKYMVLYIIMLIK